MENVLGEVSDEHLDFLKEVECMCKNFYQEKEEEESIILFINELKSYIYDLSTFFKKKLETSEEFEEFKTLQNIIKKKESLEAYILDDNLKCQKKEKKKKEEQQENELLKNESSLGNEVENKEEINIKNLKEKKEEAETKQRGITTGENGEMQLHMKSNNEQVFPHLNKSINTISKEGNKLENENWYSNNNNNNNNNNINNNDNVNGNKSQNSCIKTKDSSILSKDKTKKKSVSFDLNEPKGKEQEHCPKSETEKEKEKEKKKSTTENYTTNKTDICINDNIIREWSKQIDKYDNLLYEYSYEYKRNNILKQFNNKNKKKNTFNENIDEELCLLAQEMKENVLTYREILNEDNKILEETANKQLLNIETITDVSKKTKKLNQNKNISFFISLFITSVSILLFMLTFAMIVFL